MTISLRQASRADAPRLNAALARLSAELGDTHNATDAEIAAAGWGAAPLFRALLAEEGGVVAGGPVLGCALYSVVFSTARGGGVVHVSDLWVSAEARGAGLGRRLLAGVAADAERTWGAERMKLDVYHDSPRARVFYERLGFRPATHHDEMRLDPEGVAALKGPA
ncbi:GNAT family N-acetyltransferase [Salipiger mucosus]|uniref:Acetyltransferase, GNAT family n=1 Tax=Salipiger mucosus DSM 16094 TaxID=1123237 RepID=S9Q737_9RHOB|nr:N-acetyltransferase [Salipiger mucosus]EPX75453.1 acetyltransferase, GNAT family [Salipiger mucosus DSM 16094]